MTKLNDVYKSLGLPPKKESETLKKMTKDEILNMTLEQAKTICEEIGSGWIQTRNELIIFGVDQCENGVIKITW